MINYIKGDVLKHVLPQGTISIIGHACNPRGRWGAGVATQFKAKFPSTYPIHQQHCKKLDLLGTSQLIPSDKSDIGNLNRSIPAYILCLFTADLHKKHSPTTIANNTELALDDLVKQLEELDLPFEKENGKYLINILKINSGLFFTPWELTEAVLNKFDLVFNVYVFD